MNAEDREDREDREFMAGIEADVARRLPAALEFALDLTPYVDQLAPWAMVGHVVRSGITLGPPTEHFPGVDPMDVTWPDGTFKVFPDRVEYLMNVDLVAPDTRDMWLRIQAEVADRRLEESILEELSQIITERGADAPGLLIIRSPSGEWAMTESEWLTPGSAVLSTMEAPDLMAVAQGDGWLYYRQGPGWAESVDLADKGESRPNDWTPATPDLRVAQRSCTGGARCSSAVHISGCHGETPDPEPRARSAWEADLPEE